MLVPVVRAREDRAPFVPDDLLGVKEIDSEQAVQYFARETDACQTYAIWRLGTSSNASDQSARVSPEMVVSVCPFVRCFM